MGCTKEGELAITGPRVSVWEDEKFLEMESGNVSAL